MNYGRNKLKSTKYLINKSKKKLINGVILRLYQVYGPNQSSNRFLPIIINKCLMKCFVVFVDFSAFEEFDRWIPPHAMQKMCLCTPTALLME